MAQLLWSSLIWALVNVLVGYSIGKKRGHPVGACVLSLIFGPFGWIFAAIWQKSIRTCPSCTEQVRREARVCRYCGEQLIPVPAEGGCLAALAFLLGTCAIVATFYYLFNPHDSGSVRAPVASPVSGTSEQLQQAPISKNQDVASEPPALTHEIDIAVTIAGEDAVKIQDGHLWFEHISAMHHAMPSGILLNGKPWQPSWHGRTSSSFSDFQPPLAPFPPSGISVIKLAGRDTVSFDSPSTANHQSLSIDIVDHPVGSDRYEIRVHW